jgi:hypothetical protein
MAVRLSAYAPAALNTQEYSWYSFLLEAESTPGLCEVGRIRRFERSNDLIWDRICDFPVCSIAPRPTALPRVHWINRIVGCLMVLGSHQGYPSNSWRCMRDPCNRKHSRASTSIPQGSSSFPRQRRAKQSYQFLDITSALGLSCTVVSVAQLSIQRQTTEFIQKKIFSVAWVCERTIPTDRPPPVRVVSADFMLIQDAT